MSSDIATAMIDQTAKRLLADPQQIGDFAVETVRATNVDAVNAYLLAGHRQDLLHSLNDMLETVDAVNPDSKPRVGLIGRLLGKDLQHREDNRRRVQDFPLRLRRADEQMQMLQVAEQNGKQLLMLLVAQTKELFQQTQLGSEVLRSAHFSNGLHATEADRLHQRLHTLTMLQQSWMLTQKHLELDIQQSRQILDRYQHIRDTLIPIWQQHMLAKASNKQGASKEQSALREALATIISEFKTSDREI